MFQLLTQSLKIKILLRVMNVLNYALEHTIIVPKFDVFFNELKEKA